MELSFCVDEMKMKYCPAHKSIYENETANSLYRNLLQRKQPIFHQELIY